MSTVEPTGFLHSDNVGHGRDQFEVIDVNGKSVVVLYQAKSKSEKVKPLFNGDFHKNYR